MNMVIVNFRCRLSVLLLAAFFAAGNLAAAPAQIIFLRHAEKPEFGAELNERGRERASALAGLLAKDPRVLEHGTPAAVFAMKPAKAKGSVRAIQTMEPTARALHLTLNTTFTRDELAPLARAIMEAPGFDGKTVVVCWEHDATPKMPPQFGWPRGPTK